MTEPGRVSSGYRYPFTRNEVCEGSGQAAPIGSVLPGFYTDCRTCGRRIYVHPKGSLAKHTRTSAPARAQAPDADI